jgi:hypothetical protein
MAFEESPEFARSGVDIPDAIVDLLEADICASAGV